MTRRLSAELDSFESLMQAMDAIHARPEAHTPEEIAAVMGLAIKALGWFMIEEGLAVDEALKRVLEEADPEGRA